MHDAVAVLPIAVKCSDLTVHAVHQTLYIVQGVVRCLINIIDKCIANVYYNIWKTIRERRFLRIGQIIRNNEWITIIIEGKVDGKSGGRRPSTTFMKQIIEDVEKTNYKELKVAMMDSKKINIFYTHYYR